jgi:hypothetical protein|tara:strand:+ start:28827 stop:29006 length:180 start_codon:yes stop_codon:yes gene_type:complete
MLEPFTKEERIIFGLHIIEVEREKNKKKSLTPSQEKRFSAKIEKLKKERSEFLKTHKIK